ncbi:MAG: histidine kinase [Saprospiraceae bacterium]
MIKKVLTSLLLVLPGLLSAQWRGPRFDVFNAKDDLPSNYIWSICQDSTGFIYFALNDQLVRYDGRTFKDYFHHPNDPASIGPGQVNKMIYSSRAGKIWMAMRREGLNAFNPVTEKFQHFGAFVANCITEDTNGQIWLGGTPSILYRFDPATEKFTTFHLADSIGVPIPNTSITAIVQDRNEANTLWISYLDLLSESGSIPEHLVQFDKVSGHFRPTSCPGLVHFQNQEGQLFCGSWSNGLWRYDPTNKSCEHMELDTTFSNGLSTNSGAFNITRVNQKYWVTSRQAIFEFNDDLKPKPVFYQKDLVTFNSLFTDKNKNIWVGSNAGLFVMSPKKQKIDFFSLDQFGIPSRIYPGRLAYSKNANAIYLAGDSCLFKIPLNKFFPAEKIPAPVDPTGIAVDEKDRIWVAMEDRHFYLFNEGNKTFIRAKDLNWPEIETNRLWQLACFDGHTLIGISSNEVYWMDTRNPDWNVNHHPRDPPLTFAHNRISRSINGHYLLSYGPEIIEVDLTTGIEHKLNRGSTCIQHPDGSYWIIDINHLGVYSRTGDSLNIKKYYTPADDGIHVGSGYMLHVDYRQRVWAFGESGISVIDPSSNEIRNVGVADGLVTPTMDPIQILDLPDHRMVMPNGNGIIVFDPDQVWDATSIVDGPVVINEVRVNGKPIAAELLRKKQLELSPSQNTLEFEFQALVYPSDRNITYSYRVKDLSDRWQFIGRSNLVTLAQVPSGTYELQVKTATDRDIPITTFQFVIRFPFYRDPLFQVMVVFLFGVVIYLWYRRRINTIQKNEEQKARHVQQVAELELQTLRAQMNPHFMFNSLNSIKNYILKNDPERSAQYLSNFAHLIRLILQHSREKWIPLKIELDTLLLYIELEKIRFREGFTYSCEVDENIDLNEVMLPPMILMPYVENAIWHGLLHKEENRHLAIRIDRVEDQVVCIIEDNGIGRAMAAELKSRSATQYKSMGISINNDRIHLLNSMNAKGISIEILDKMDDIGVPAGTKVILKMPVQNATI